MMLIAVLIAAVAALSPPDKTLPPENSTPILSRVQPHRVKVLDTAPGVTRLKLMAFEVAPGATKEQVDLLVAAGQQSMHRHAGVGAGGQGSSTCRFSDLGEFIDVPFAINRNMPALDVPWPGPGTFHFEGCFGAVPELRASCLDTDAQSGVAFGGTHYVYQIGANGGTPYVTFTIDNVPAPPNTLVVGPGDGVLPFSFDPPEGGTILGTSVLVLVTAEVPVSDPTPFEVPFTSNIGCSGFTDTNTGFGAYVAEIWLFSIGGFGLTPNP